MATPTTADLFVEVLSQDGPNWFDIGVYLGASITDLREIRKNYTTHGIITCLAELHDCLVKKGKPLTWEAIATALRRLDNHRLADSIHSKYILKGFLHVAEKISNVRSEIKVTCFLLHGAPESGKTCVRGLLFNLPPCYYPSTDLVEDPVRGICTIKAVSITNRTSDQPLLKMVNEGEIRQMIQEEVISRLSMDKEDDNQQDQDATVNIAASTPSRNVMPLKPSRSQLPQPKDSQVLREIATAIDKLEKTNMPPLFQCHHINIVDSGGQSQFTNLLPLVLRSHSHNHLVVIRLDEKLHDRPKNRFNKQDLPEHLTLTAYQLIERVCQLASGSKAHVIVVGTRLDQENKEEPLEKKIEMLEPLLKKYPDNLVFTDDKKPAIFAVNAIESEKDKREKYAKTLQEVILDAPTLTESGALQSNGSNEVPLLWFVLEIELSRRSKDKAGVIAMREINDIANNLNIMSADLNEALALFTRLAMHYHYPQVFPDKIFTSITPIASQLSSIVKASFPSKPRTKCPNQDMLQTTGRLTKEYLKKLCDNFPSIPHFSTDDFLRLMEHLRVLFHEKSESKFLLPSLLPVDDTHNQQPLDDYYEPLLCYWNNGNQDIRILPQSYFHALINELLREKGVELARPRQNFRSRFQFLITASPDCIYHLVIVDCVSWLEIFVDDCIRDCEECRRLVQVIQSCTQRVLKQLDLKELGELQYGLRCYSDQCKYIPVHLSRCTIRDCFVFTCFNECKRWMPMNKDDKRLYLIKGLCNSDSEISATETQTRSGMVSIPLPVQSVDVLNAPVAPGVSAKDIFVQHSANLANIIATDPIWFAGNFAAVHLIPPTLVGNLNSQHALTDHEKATKLVSALHTNLDTYNNPKWLLMTCDVLKKQQSLLTDTIVAKILEQLGTSDTSSS